jgi:hypothetical protein
MDSGGGSLPENVGRSNDDSATTAHPARRGHEPPTPGRSGYSVTALVLFALRSYFSVILLIVASS